MNGIPACGKTVTLEPLFNYNYAYWNCLLPDFWR
jgi:hypothetical protein